MSSQKEDHHTFEPYDAVCQQLDQALHADDCAEKDFHIRQALQATEAVDENDS